MRLIITWLDNTKWQIGKVSSPFPQDLQAPTLVGLWLRVRGSQLPIHMFHWSFGLIISLELPETFYLLSYKTYKQWYSGDLGWGAHTQKPKWLLSLGHIMSHDKLERFYLLLTRPINSKLGKVVAKVTGSHLLSYMTLFQRYHVVSHDKLKLSVSFSANFSHQIFKGCETCFDQIKYAAAWNYNTNRNNM